MHHFIIMYFSKCSHIISADAPYGVLVGGVNKVTDRMQGSNFVYLVLQKLVAGELYEYNTDK